MVNENKKWKKGKKVKKKKNPQKICVLFNFFFFFFGVRFSVIGAVLSPPLGLPFFFLSPVNSEDHLGATGCEHGGQPVSTGSLSSVEFGRFSESRVEHAFDESDAIPSLTAVRYGQSEYVVSLWPCRCRCRCRCCCRCPSKCCASGVVAVVVVVFERGGAVVRSPRLGVAVERPRS